MKKVKLVNYIYCDNIYVKELAHPIGLLTLMQLINQRSLDMHVDVLDPNLLIYTGQIDPEDILRGDFESLAREILKDNPAIVGFSTIADTFDISVRLAIAIKSYKPEIMILMGGPQATALAHSIMEAFSFVDMVYLGEGETAMLPALEYLLGLGEESKLENVVYRKKDKIISARFSHDLVDLDALPIIEYLDDSNFSNIELEVGRGCPFNCYFCSTNRFWKQHFRVKSVDRVISEIKYYLSKFGNSKTFSFTHDLFTMNKSYVMQLCSKIREENLNFRWGCSARADTLDEEMLLEMKTAGCHSIFIGVESGSTKMQKIMRKNLNFDKLYEVLDILKRIEIRTKLSFIYDFPEESREDFEQTLSLIGRIKRKYGFTVMLSRCTFYPRTDLFEQHFSSVSDNNFLPKNRLCMQDVNSLIRHKAMYSAYFTYREVNYFGNIESFVNYYLNLLGFYFEATIRSMLDHFNSLSTMCDYMDNFIEQESGKLLGAGVAMSHKKGIATMCEDFGKYALDYGDGMFSDEVAFDLLFLEKKLSTRQ